MDADVIVIGAGMAGASVAAELSHSHTVLLLEAEAQPGYHSTGRSAAVFIENYGNDVVRTLNRASRAHLLVPRFDTNAASLLSERGVMYVASHTDVDRLKTLVAQSPGVVPISLDDAKSRLPLLRLDRLEAAAFEADAMDIDVNRMHHGYLAWLKRRGGHLICNARVTHLKFANNQWAVTTNADVYQAPVIVNAAGAWADNIATLASVKPLGLTPLRRSAALLATPADLDVSHWPVTLEAAENWYCKPDAGRILVSPADETLVEPHDAWPEDLDLAQGIDRFSQTVDFQVTRVEHSWAGLRTFAPDRSLVIGFDPKAAGFFWMAGQGGYGIQTATAAARFACHLLRDEKVDDDLAEIDAVRHQLSPARF